MRWFTLEWWAGDTEHDPLGDYAAHVACIRTRLPSELIALSERGVLHDANVRRTMVARDSAMLLLAVYAEGGVRELLELRYEGVVSFESTTNPDRALGGPAGYGDLGYDEIDLDAEGRCIHRMLFSSSIQIEVCFTQFSCRQSPLPSSSAEV